MKRKLPHHPEVNGSNERDSVASGCEALSNLSKALDATLTLHSSWNLLTPCRTKRPFILSRGVVVNHK